MYRDAAVVVVGLTARKGGSWLPSAENSVRGLNSASFFCVCGLVLLEVRCRWQD